MIDPFTTSSLAAEGEPAQPAPGDVPNPVGDPTEPPPPVVDPDVGDPIPAPGTPPAPIVA